MDGKRLFFAALFFKFNGERPNGYVFPAPAK